MVSRRRVLRGGCAGLVAGVGLAGCGGRLPWRDQAIHATLASLARLGDGYLTLGGYQVGDDEDEESQPWLARLGEGFALERRWNPDIPEEVQLQRVASIGEQTVLVGDDEGRPWLRGFEPDLSVAWTRTYDDLDGVTVTAITDWSSHPLVAGTSYPSRTHESGPDDPEREESQRMYLGRLDQSGRYTSILEFNPRGVVRDLRTTAEDIYVCGSLERRRDPGGVFSATSDPWVGRYNENDRFEVLFRGDGGEFDHIAGAADGHAVVGELENDINPSRTPVVRGLSPDGSRRWDATPELGTVTDVASSDDGVVVAGHFEESLIHAPTPQGTERPPTGPWAAAYDGDGEQRWLIDPETTFVRAYGVQRLDGDRYAVVGTRESENGDELDAWLAVLEADGTVARSQRYDPPTD